MNIKVLDKIESAWISWDWKDSIDRIWFTDDQLDTLYSTIANFRSNRGAKELALCKYQRLPVYITIVKSEYGEFLDWLYERCIDRELYELCKRIVELKSKL